MFRRIITAAFLLISAFAPIQAQEPKIYPIQPGKFYDLWFSSGETTGNLKFVKPDTSVEVLERTENWIRVKSIGDPKYARVLWGVAQVKAGTEIGQRVLAETKKTRESLINEAENHPMAPLLVKEMWFNLDRITGFQEITVK